MTTQFRCKNERRRASVRETRVNGQTLVNGIDYLEVADDQHTLFVMFIHPLEGSQAPSDAISLTTDNILITGGTRLQGVEVESVSIAANLLLVRVNQVGDYSTYTLRLVNTPTDPTPPPGIDSQLAQVNFSFWVEEFSEFDCQPSLPLPEKAPPPPPIDYLAKDYASFRQLMLDRLAVTLPQWQERNPSDIGMMLVEVLAYAADHLSYYQDAVATEAYLGTARKRVSVRRHARLLDYFLHDGCNARAWVVIQLNPEKMKRFLAAQPSGITLLGPSRQANRPGVQLFSRTSLAPGLIASEESISKALTQKAQVFETLQAVTLHPGLNQIEFYTWQDEQCLLPQGSTRATLADPEQILPAHLKPGSVLVFEEVRGPATGDPREADIHHRHVVRLTQVQAMKDDLKGVQVMEVAWGAEDALPFDLMISVADAQGRPIQGISVARGNVVLVDAGRTLPAEDLSQAVGWQQERPRPQLQEGPLTQQGYRLDSRNQWVTVDPKASAKAAMAWKIKDTQPAIALWEERLPGAPEAPGARWTVQQDLLNSDRFARDFVVETEDDGRAYLRFGDGKLGKLPPDENPLYGVYRIGNGTAGNVGINTIRNIRILPSNLDDDTRQQLQSLNLGLAELLLPDSEDPLNPQLSVYNPLPAQGGQDPESIEQVKRYAPVAFREQRRAVTAADYAQMAQRYPGVQKALATRRWTGSWHTIFITVDREAGLPVDQSFKEEILKALEAYRLAGHDIEIESPRFVPLDIAMTVQVQPDYFRSAVKKALLDTFSNRILDNDQVGFFQADRFSFGDPVYLSQVVETAMQVTGVESVNVTRLQRWGRPPNQELEQGQIRLERLEIARLDNTPSNPENGRIEFKLKGGL
jgi:hypothetical protein